ncbi:MAG: hypothetical protein NT154_14710 [Verrucomicrobia bacterium]|nr:hypothetical protein [Verrucomicrobiota bacterium]
MTAMRRMPKGLRTATGLSLLMTLFLPAAFLPVGEHFVNGDRVSFTEFWHRGGGIAFATIGLLSLVLSYGFIMARGWARPLALVTGWAVVFTTWVGWQGFTLEVALGLLFFGCLPTWYFYFRQPVREYFGASHESRVA